MTERQARQEDLQYTGHYSHDIETVKEKAKEIRTQGFRAVVVTIRGYSLYTETKYHVTREISEVCERIAQADSRREALKAKHIQEFSELEADITANVHHLDELEEKLKV